MYGMIEAQEEQHSFKASKVVVEFTNDELDSARIDFGLFCFQFGCCCCCVAEKIHNNKQPKIGLLFRLIQTVDAFTFAFALASLVVSSFCGLLLSSFFSWQDRNWQDTHTQTNTNRQVPLFVFLFSRLFALLYAASWRQFAAELSSHFS